MAPTSSARPLGNRLLALLSPETLEMLQPHFERIELPTRHVLHPPFTKIDAVHFPESGWISMVALHRDGNAAEVGLIGREGMVGLPLLLGSDRSSVETMVQAPVIMLRLPEVHFHQAITQAPELRRLLGRYALALHTQVTHTAARNGAHALEQRMARWLLIAHDRADGAEFPMTHEFLAMMLCVHRPGVSVNAKLLQQAKLIEYERGQLKVIDRAGLEAVACECYGVVRGEFDRLLGLPTS